MFKVSEAREAVNHCWVAAVADFVTHGECMSESLMRCSVSSASGAFRISPAVRLRCCS